MTAALRNKPPFKWGPTMRSKFALSVAACLLLTLTVPAQGAEPAKPSAPGSQPVAARVDRAGGVTVKVTPRSLATEAPVWEFAVVLDTHSVNLADDLARSSVLIDAQGRRHAPLMWEG